MESTAKEPTLGELAPVDPWLERLNRRFDRLDEGQARLHAQFASMHVTIRKILDVVLHIDKQVDKLGETYNRRLANLERRSSTLETVICERLG